MAMRPFLVPLQLRAVLYHFGAVLQLLAATFAVPLLCALVTREWLQAGLFALLAALCYGAGRLARQGRARELAVREALVVTALTYFVFALIGAVAFLPVASFVDGFFEAMSGFTTTGLSVLDVATLPPSLLLFRAYSQWIGGVGVIVLSLVVLIGPGRGAFRLYASEFGEDNLIGSVVATARVVAVVYLALTALAYVAFVLAGMGWWDGLLHAFATLSTGGFSVYGESIGVYDSAWITGVTTLFMALGAISFPLFYLAWREGWRRLVYDIQVRTLVGVLAVATLLFFLFSGASLSALLPGLFQLTSVFSTTGFSVMPSAEIPDGALVVMIGLMIIGGSAGSTSGGIKLFRLLVLAKLGGREIVRLLLSEQAKLPVKVSDVVISEDELKETITLVVFYATALFGAWLLLVASGSSLESGLFMSASALSTAGLSFGTPVAELPLVAKLTLCFNMWLGRVEILPVLILLYPNSWRP